MKSPPPSGFFFSLFLNLLSHALNSYSSYDFLFIFLNKNSKLNLLIIWVFDLLVSSSDQMMLLDVFCFLIDYR